MRGPRGVLSMYVEWSERLRTKLGAFFSVLLGLGVELDEPLADGQDGGLRAVIDL